MHFFSYKKFALILFIILFMIFPLSAYCASSFVTYTVEKGDTLWSIAKTYDISLTLLLSYNNFTEKTIIKPGMEIKIPTKSPTLSLYKYTVKPGDSLWKIAKNFEISLSSLLTVNHLKQNALIQPGDILIIPKEKETGIGGSWDEKTVPKKNHVVYIVSKGDTLWSIARKYNIKVSTLASYNGIRETSVLSIGKKILVPRKGTTYTPEKKVSPQIKTKTKPKAITYIVSKGDTLWSIARKYNIKVSTLASYNGIRETSVLSIGKKILVPRKGTTYTPEKKVSPQIKTKTKPKAITYIVSKGDTLWSIARKYNIKVSTLASYNGIRDLNRLKLGQKLQIPQGRTYTYKAPQKKVSYLYYTVKRGDTLWGLSRRFNISIKTLAGLNGLSEKSTLRIGKTLKIPYRGSYTGISFRWPTRGRLTSPFGWRILRGRRQYHTGIDIANRIGTPIYAAASGKVIFAGWIRGYGRVIIISHAYDYSTVYGHCSKLLVKTGQYVRQGQYIAKMGNTGYTTGPHLHFEIRKRGTPQNPLNYLR